MGRPKKSAKRPASNSATPRDDSRPKRRVIISPDDTPAPADNTSRKSPRVVPFTDVTNGGGARPARVATTPKRDREAVALQDLKSQLDSLQALRNTEAERVMHELKKAAKEKIASADKLIEQLECENRDMKQTSHLLHKELADARKRQARDADTRTGLENELERSRALAESLREELTHVKPTSKANIAVRCEGQCHDELESRQARLLLFSSELEKAKRALDEVRAENGKLEAELTRVTSTYDFALRLYGLITGLSMSQLCPVDLTARLSALSDDVQVQFSLQLSNDGLEMEFVPCEMALGTSSASHLSEDIVFNTADAPQFLMSLLMSIYPADKD
ncbi:hypothetical protein FVE85_5642 [Porphyridium purpureum]|uniref:Monopolin complex subunit Csm1/Pcs1 C-terminal domain-containing protein n=1 Tax=Porphyridium purpureum TaxID=35688 RepID=A0A5J4Z5Y5_PORPP|nr:hypothetical protein FVE85_5642 [Porphyridium purpureum]|eukprot:POR4024..scf295_1